MNFNHDNEKAYHARAKSAAEHFDISVSTLWNWAKNRVGFPKPIRASSRVTLWDINAITAYIKADAAKSGGAV